MSSKHPFFLLIIGLVFALTGCVQQIESNPNADFSCALLSNNDLKCWGANFAGQLGQGHTNIIGNLPNQMGSNLPAIDLGSDQTIVDYAVGGQHACVLFESGVVKCWGNNVFGQLGLGDIIDRGSVPGQMGENLPEVDLGEESSVKKLALLHGSSCALFENGKVKCWGGNFYGQLGLEDYSNRGVTPNQMGNNLPFIDFGTGLTVKDIFTGSEHACVLFDPIEEEGFSRIKCWGSNGLGQLGLGNTNNYGDEPGDMGDNLPFVEPWQNNADHAGVINMSLGTFHTCAQAKNFDYRSIEEVRPSSHTLSDKSRGQIPSDVMERLKDVPEKIISSIKEDHANTKTVRAPSHITTKCWGGNFYGQLGLGDEQMRGNQPGQLGDNLPWVDLLSPNEQEQGWRQTKKLTSGHEHNCMVLDNHLGQSKAKCWGQNKAISSFQLSPDVPPDITTEIATYWSGLVTPWYSISDDFSPSVGGIYFYTIDYLNNMLLPYILSYESLDGTLGLGHTIHQGNLPGQMGENLPEVSIFEVPDNAIHQIKAGTRHTCALGGLIPKLKCWGVNQRGQLGQGHVNSIGDQPNQMGENLPEVDL